MTKQELVNSIAAKLSLPEKAVTNQQEWFAENHSAVLHDALLAERDILVADMSVAVSDAYDHWLGRYNKTFPKRKK